MLSMTPIALTPLAILAAVAVFLWLRERANRTRLEGRLESLEAFASEVQSATERDRAEISRSMHDQIGGILVASKMDLDWVGRRLPAVDETVRAKLAQVASALDSGLAIKRGFVERLRPSILDHLGLFAALQWQLTELSNAAGLESTATVADVDPGFSAESAIRVFRIAHAAIEHALHAPEVGLIELDARINGEIFELDVTDDGAAPSAPPSAWLSAISHRAESLGGTCTSERRADGGTRVSVRIPVARLMRPPRA
jgi:signal transduction histidine kinase